MIDRDLAELYGVQTKHLNRQVRRNKKRFPSEFVFRLTKREAMELVTIWHRFGSLKHSASLPFAFTEHGVAMLSSVLNSDRAIAMNVLIIKTFVRLREVLSTHKEIALKLKELETRVDRQSDEIRAIFESIHQIMAHPILRASVASVLSWKNRKPGMCPGYVDRTGFGSNEPPYLVFFFLVCIFLVTQ